MTVKEKRRTFNVAHVGAFKKRSEDDVGRTIEAITRVGKYDREMWHGRRSVHDVINLKDGRDFLKETRRYDLVITHSIFHPKVVQIPKRVCKELLLSERHSEENWRRRLVSTGAAYLVICEGQPMSLSGWHLGDIDGYEILERDHLITVYRKRTCEQ